MGESFSPEGDWINYLFEVSDMKRSYLLPLLLACSVPFTQAAETLEVEPYHYGQDLDIAKVIGIDDPQDPFVCEVITARMSYLNSTGELKTISYRKLAKACSRQGG